MELARLRLIQNFAVNLVSIYYDTSHYQNFEPPFEIPDSWEWVRLENLTSKIGSGSTPKGSNYSEQGIPFFRSQNIHNHGLVYDDIKFISQSINESMGSTIVHANDLLLNITGGSIGRCAVVPSNFEEGNVSQHVCIIRPLLISSDYLHLYILSDLFWKSMKLTGSGREGLPKYNLEKMSLPVPPLGEQHRIVDALKEYNTILTVIENSSKGILNDITSTKNIILELAMQGKLVSQDPTDEPAADMLKRINPKAKIITDNPHYPKLPNNWVLTDIQSVSNYGKCDSVVVDDIKEDDWILELEDIEKDSGIILEKKRKSDREIKGVRHSFQSGDILYSKLRTYLNKVLIAPNSGYCSTEIIPIKCLDSVTSQYLCVWLRSPYFLAYTQSCGYGVKMPRISTTDVRNGIVPLPPLNEQRRIMEQINSIFKALDSISNSVKFP